MHISIPLQSQPATVRISRKSLFPNARTHLAVLTAATALFSAQSLFGAQPPVAKPPASPHTLPAAHKPTHHHKNSKASHSPAPFVQAAAPVTPPVPEPPHWPANDRPADASITWDSHGLRINAENSSLKQILKDVSTATGATVEGLASDQRIFGVYGPGQARDVLSQLLEGSGYNVIMIGDQGEGTPRQIVLSARGGASTAQSVNPAPPAANEDDPDPDEQPEPQPGEPAGPRHGRIGQPHPPQ